MAQPWVKKLSAAWADAMVVQKKELQVWTAHIRLRANKPTGLGRIGGETAAALEDPAEHISDIPVQNPW